ncbi:TM2 domain-containing protein [Chryseobacterium profundimaris]|nr:TM2 domain-containing protein [Chryseobacterium profundimaris]
MMKKNINEFAFELRNKYPNTYNDLEDDELVKLWLKKFPGDKSKIIDLEDHLQQVTEPIFDLNDNVLYIPNSITDRLPAMVRNELKKLHPSKQEEFLEEYKRRKKSVFVGYMCWLIFGWQYAYIRKWGVQILYWFTGGGFLIWAFIDLFRIPKLVSNYNKDVSIEVMRNLKSIS